MQTRSGYVLRTPDSRQQDEASDAKRQKLEVEVSRSYFLSLCFAINVLFFSRESSMFNSEFLGSNSTTLPSETFHDVFKCLDRDALDSVMLVCRSTRDSVRTLENDHLARRVVAQVSLGDVRQ